MKNQKGFTLIELLVVVLIVGILTAVAVPAYKKAMEKSKVAEALTTMDAVAKSEHNWFLTSNRYTDDFANLDVNLVDKDGIKVEGETYDSMNYKFTLQSEVIKAERSNQEYTLYKLYEGQNIYCLPKKHYICEQYGWGVNRKLCEENLEGVWHNSSSSHNFLFTPQPYCSHI